jgi:hypothetical protein
VTENKKPKRPNSLHLRLGEDQTLTATEAKKRLLEFIKNGLSVEDACRLTNKSTKTFYYYTKSDPDFNKELKLIRALQSRKGQISTEDKEISFEDFRQKYLNQQTFPHQRNMIDMIESSQPSWLHDSMVFEKGLDQYVLVNMPPEHAKSMTVSIDYVTYRICIDPNVRIKLVSKTQQMAKEFLYAVKQRLTSHQYMELQRRYAPADGYKATADKWTADSIYIERDSGEKDPTLQALGIGGQIYGARSDLIILDDCVTLANAGEYEKQIRWIQQEVLTRIGPTGKLLIVGTRVNPIDLYRELRNPDRYPDNKSPWTYLAMPAVLEFDEDPNNWTTLWPKSDQPWANDPSGPDKDGLYPRWDGRFLRQRRGVLDAKTWAMVYQQQDVQAEAIFAPELVRAAANGLRGCGPLVPGAPGYPRSTDGFHTVCAMDPAMSGDTFTVAITGDKNTKKRYLLDASRITAPTPQRIREIIFQYTEKYKPAVWAIEKNAFQLFLTRDEEINKFLQSRGIRLVQHYTGKNKLDLEYGVASLAQLFGTFGPDGKPAKDSLLELPRPESEGVKALIEQLITWAPDTRNKQDGPMALWMAETQLRDYVNQSGAYGNTFIRNPFATPNDLARRQVVNLEEYAEKQRLANIGWY